MENGKMYIGRTLNFSSRSRAHVGKLRKNIHYNLNLQEDFNNKHELIMFPVEICSEDNMKQRELFWINYHGTLLSHLGYNQESDPKSGFTQNKEWVIKRTVHRKGKPANYSDEHIKKLSNAAKKKKGRKVKGVEIKFINNKTGEINEFISIDSAANYLNMCPKTFCMKFYKTRKRIKQSVIIINDYTITRKDVS